MSAVGPGDWVQCVDDSPTFPSTGHEYPRPHIRVTGCYCVERVIPDCGPGHDLDAFELVGIHAADPDGQRAAFFVGRFKPLGGAAGKAMKRVIPIRVGAGYEDALI